MREKSDIKEKRIEHDAIRVFAPKGVEDFLGRDTPGRPSRTDNAEISSANNSNRGQDVNRTGDLV